MLETICSWGVQTVMGASAFIGAAINAGFSIHEKSKEKGFKFEFRRVADTIWQSVGAGLAAGLAVGCSWYGIILAALTGIGIDKIANRFKIGETQVLNVAKWMADIVEKKTK